MKYFLSIIIPRYTETEQDIFPLLSSISGQCGIDFSELEVIIVNDGGGAGQLDNDFLSLFKMEVRQISLSENRGPGVTRQVGLDSANGDYIMFCDADDMLHNVGVLSNFIGEAKNNVPDIITSDWLEEAVNQSGELVYITHNYESTWMHGKLLRRRFLLQNGIRFHDDLRVHEDSYFLGIASTLAGRTNHLPILSYVWKYRPDSITRRNNRIYSYESIPTFIKASCMGHKEIESRFPSVMEFRIIQFVLYIYFLLQAPEWHTMEHSTYLGDSEITFSEQMVPYWHYWQNAGQDKIAEIYNQERKKSFDGGIERETVEQWISRMMNNIY